MANPENVPKFGITVTGPHQDGMWEARIEGTELWVRSESLESLLQNLIKLLPPVDGRD